MTGIMCSQFVFFFVCFFLICLLLQTAVPTLVVEDFHIDAAVFQSCKSRPKSDPGLLASQLSLPPSDESIAERQQRLQQEAKMALAQVI